MTKLNVCGCCAQATPENRVKPIGNSDFVICVIIISLLSSLSSSDRKFPEQDPLGTPPRYSWHYLLNFFLGAYSHGQRSGARIKPQSGWRHHAPPHPRSRNLPRLRMCFAPPPARREATEPRTASHKVA